MKVRIHRLAQREMTEAAQWYNDRRPGLGDTFLDALAAAVLFSVEFPLTGSLVTGALRRRRLRKFPYEIVYLPRVEAGLLDVLAVAHSRRRPRYWARRKME